MARPTRARIDLDALRHNFLVARELAGSARLVAVVKANGYGHGAVPVARALVGAADAFGVACVEEALELRESGISAPILLLEGVVTPDELALVDRHRLAMVVHQREQLEWVQAARPARPLACWLKLDSGMHRLGLTPEAFAAAYAQLAACPAVGDLVLMTHLARADEPQHPYTRQQLALCAEVWEGLAAPRSLVSSPGLIAWPAGIADWVRPGIMLYGASPLGDGHPSAARLRPVMTLESALIAVRDLGPGEAIGYGGRFVCARPTRVGVVAAGYADGYPRHARDGTPVAVAGRPTRLIGRVSMDMLTVDLTELPQAHIGDRVELWGGQVSANAVAAASDTIAYTLFTGVTGRVPLRYEPADGDAAEGRST
ncbi:alanine racemase [Candidatus Thiodictyon syntrophicum]|jgi:alanine racemase|uniref:Alanine racemase n=1 Tax=Candidatus Thiodictyon syntrophicum TaxID=1166950 RepID=A0A2K8UA29_9GAMM|nr:alanine racemase [Candidatus Thiodictyon syntrophicum]AUB82387.1 alanine racemase [Candidatus Thiodictyon syntrophicum]